MDFQSGDGIIQGPYFRTSLINRGLQVKGPSCPLCKASCDFITRQEVDSSGKLDETVVVVGKKEIGSSSASQRTVVLVSLVSCC